MKNYLNANFFSMSHKTNNAAHLKHNTHNKVRRPMSYPDNDLLVYYSCSHIHLLYLKNIYDII